MHTAGELVARAGVVGLVTQREVLDGVVGVRDESRSNCVHAIMVRDRPVAYVKQRGARPAPGDDDVIGRERRVLRALEELDHLVPHLVGAASAADTWSDTLWVGALSGRDLNAQRGRFAELVAVVQAWGTALAELHRAPVGAAAPVAPQPWVVATGHRRAGMARPLDGCAAQVRGIADSRPLRRAAEDVAQRWTTRHWIHGDVSASNVVVEHAGWLRVRFLDFDHGGLGDPAWDVATALDTIERLAPAWGAPSRLLAEHFLHGYRHADGPGHLTDALRAVRAVVTAAELAATSAGAPDVAQVESWLDRARRLAAGALVRAA